MSDTIDPRVAEELRKLQGSGHATQDERLLAAMVNASKPVPEVKPEVPLVLSENDGHYWPQRFKKHPFEYDELRSMYKAGDTIYCLHDDRSLFVIPADAVIADGRVSYVDGRTWNFPRANLIDVVMDSVTVTADCEYCGLPYPVPVEEHHTEEECNSYLAEVVEAEKRLEAASKGKTSKDSKE